MLTSQANAEKEAEFQFKNAIMTLAAEAAILVTDDPQKTVKISTGILNAISRVRCYRPKSRCPSQPRVTKRPPNKWCSNGREKFGTLQNRKPGCQSRNVCSNSLFSMQNISRVSDKLPPLCDCLPSVLDRTTPYTVSAKSFSLILAHTRSGSSCKRSHIHR